MSKDRAPNLSLEGINGLDAHYRDSFQQSNGYVGTAKATLPILSPQPMPGGMSESSRIILPSPTSKIRVILSYLVVSECSRGVQHLNTEAELCRDPAIEVSVESIHSHAVRQATCSRSAALTVRHGFPGHVDPCRSQ